MRNARRLGVLAVLVLAAGLWPGAAAAEDPGEAGNPASWAAVPAETLEEQRGGAALEVDDDLLVSLNLIDATVDNTVNAGGDVTAIAGNVSIGTSGISGNTLSITAINTGNNVVMNNTAAVNIYLH